VIVRLGMMTLHKCQVVARDERWFNPSIRMLIAALPPKREKPAMTPDERSKLQKELIAARDRQAAATKARGGAARAEPMKP
jgi:hypothetical protein